MTFRSPWRHAWFTASVAVLRRLLRPFPGAENALVERLADQQNDRVRAHLADHPARSVLMIVPRCVKKKGCRADVQSSLDECLACRQCPLGDVAAACDRHRVRALVAFRSHEAFAMARRRKPDLIIASACHDRMIKALRNVPEVPALLAPLSGMERMCINATIDLQWLDSALSGAAPAVRADSAEFPTVGAADCP